MSIKVEACSKRGGMCASQRSITFDHRLAKDRDPVDADKINAVLTFLSGKLSDDDYSQVEDMLDDAVDDAEEANPSTSAMDANRSVGTRRIVRRAVRQTRPSAKTAPSMATDAAGFASRFPDAAKIAAAPVAQRRGAPVDSKAFDERYPDAKRIKVG